MQKLAAGSANWDMWLRSRWLPLGFVVFLSAFFWAPERHDYKLLVNYFLLLPALLAALNFAAWRTVLDKPLFWLALAYLSYMTAIALLKRTDNAAEYIKWSGYLLLFLFAVGLRMDIRQRRLAQLLLLTAAVAAAAVVYAVAYDYCKGLFDGAEDYRLTGYGALYNPLRSAHLFGAFAAIAFWFAATRQGFRRERMLAWLAGTICFIGVLLSGSRSPLFALFGVGLYLALREVQPGKRLVALGLLIFFSAMIGVALWPELTERGLSLRPEIWRYTWSLIVQHPWFGAGLNAPLTIPVAGTVFVDTHNILLAAMFRGGIVGLALFAAQYILALYLLHRDKPCSPLQKLAIVLTLYGLLTLQFDGGSLIGRPTEFWVLLWLPLALALRALYADSESSKVDDLHVSTT